MELTLERGYFIYHTFQSPNGSVHVKCTISDGTFCGDKSESLPLADSNYSSVLSLFL